MVIVVPTVPEEGLKLLIVEVTVNTTLLLATTATVTTTGPVVAQPPPIFPVGAVATMLVSLQLVIGAGIVLKVTNPEP